MTNMSSTITKLEAVFDALNDEFFGGKLPKPMLTIQSTPRAYGHCSTKKIWVAGEDGRYEINIGAEYLSRPTENTCATLLHEMVHLYCLENDIKDTSQGGRYHNGNFKKEAEARQLSISYDSTIGWSVTAPTDAFRETLTRLGISWQIDFARELPVSRRAKGPMPGAADPNDPNANPDPEKPKYKGYHCPQCGQTIRTTKELFLMCGLCKVDMERF